MADAEGFVGRLTGDLSDTVAETPPKDVSTTETDGVAHPILPVGVLQTASQDRIARSVDKDGEASKGFFDILKDRFHNWTKAIAGRRHARVRKMLEDYFDVNDASAISTTVDSKSFTRKAKTILPRVWKHPIIQDLHTARSLVEIDDNPKNRRCTVDRGNVAELATRLNDIRTRFQKETGIPVKALSMAALKKNLRKGKTQWGLTDPTTGESIPTRNLDEIDRSIRRPDSPNYAGFRWARGHLVYISDLKKPDQLGELWKELAHEVATYYTLYECRGKIPVQGIRQLHRLVETAIMSSKGLRGATQYL